MKQSGGHINVYSELGTGTTFRLYLPRADGVAAAGEAAAPTDDTKADLRGTILAVEDNQSLRALVLRQLTQLGYRCLEAEDGPSALRVLSAEPVDLLLTDVVMPGGMSGYDLAHAVAERWPGTRVLLTSGFPQERMGTADPQHSGLRLLSKPYRKSDLARAVQETLRG